GHERRVVVLTGGEDVQAGLVGVPGDGEHRPHPLRVVRGPPGGRVRCHVADAEDPELHVSRLPQIVSCRCMNTGLNRAAMPDVPGPSRPPTSTHVRSRTSASRMPGVRLRAHLRRLAWTGGWNITEVPCVDSSDLFSTTHPDNPWRTSCPTGPCAV